MSPMQSLLITKLAWHTRVNKPAQISTKIKRVTLRVQSQVWEKTVKFTGTPQPYRRLNNKSRNFLTDRPRRNNVSVTEDQVTVLQNTVDNLQQQVKLQRKIRAVALMRVFSVSLRAQRAQIRWDSSRDGCLRYWDRSLLPNPITTERVHRLQDRRDETLPEYSLCASWIQG